MLLWLLRKSCACVPCIACQTNPAVAAIGVPPSLPPPIAPPTVITFSIVVEGTVEGTCTPSMKQAMRDLHVDDMASLSVTESMIDVDCGAASVHFSVTFTIPANSDVSLAHVTSVLSARYQTTVSATAFLSSLGLVVVSVPTIINGVLLSPLPACNCDAFANGWSSNDIGAEGCARDDLVHGLLGIRTVCYPPQREYIPHLDDGCTSDSFRCIVTYSQPTFPMCTCDWYANQAYEGMPNGLCQKSKSGHARVCYPRNYIGDKKIGAWENYGCPEDSCAPATEFKFARRAPTRAHAALSELRPACACLCLPFSFR